MRRSHDISGRFLGIPYDFRRPTLRKIVRRCFAPEGEMIVPKVWGLGWTLNLAHPGAWWLIGVVALAGLGACLG